MMMNLLMWPPHFFQYCKALELFRKGTSYHAVPSANDFKIFDRTWGLEKLGKYSIDNHISLFYLENWRDDLIPIWYRNVFRNRKYTILQNILKHILYTYWLKSVWNARQKELHNSSAGLSTFWTLDGHCCLAENVTSFTGPAASPSLG